jgi:CheY-like chemotaxis protein
MSVSVHVENSEAQLRRGPKGEDLEQYYSPEQTLPVVDLPSRGRILVVDDNQSVRETLSELLEVVGFYAIQAGDTLEALMILRQGTVIDVLVTDLTMPGDDGIALIRQARALKADLPAILLTGYAEQVASVAASAAGHVHVFRKPVETGRLIKQLELLVRASKD